MAKNLSLAQQIAALVSEELTKALANVPAQVEARLPTILASAIGIPTGAEMVASHLNSVAAQVAAGEAPRRRGRPAKVRPAVVETASTEEGASSASAEVAPRRRGRPPRIRLPGETISPLDVEKTEAKDGEEDGQPRRRGRPPGSKNKAKEAESPASNGAAEYAALGGNTAPQAEA